MELNKREAPSLLLEDYNYFINKAVNQYINKMYNAYDVNQQKSDDLRVLKSSVVLDLSPENSDSKSNLLGNTYITNLPDDYLHILNCVVEYKVKKNFKCYDKGDYFQIGASRLTADMYSQILHNYYLRPSYRRPYFYINNTTTKADYPTVDDQENVHKNEYVFKITENDSVEISITFKNNNSISETQSTAGEFEEQLNFRASGLGAYVTNFNILHIPAENISNLTFNGDPEDIIVVSFPSTAEKLSQNRYGNKYKVNMEIRYGKDNKVFEAKKVYVDYLKSPQYIRLTQDQVDEVEDTSQELEFPDFVTQEIINELVRLLMENASDPRLQTHIPINQSIADPAQGQQQKK